MNQIPTLRQELRIEPGAALVRGAPSWTLFDPVRHSFFQLGKIEFQIFAHWAKGSWEGLREALESEGLDAEEVDASVARVVDFSVANNLTIGPIGDTVATFTAERQRQRKAWWKWMVDNYLFFRIPLIRPAGFLARTVHHVAPFYSVKARFAFIFLAVLGLYLVSRQWDAFMASFLYFFSWQGLIAYGFGLSAVKIAHEFGHAYTATRYGVRVPSMGVSFLVMFPVLYTDVTGAWRLRARRQRLAIDCAGVTAELMVASISTLIWVMLPEGALRSVFFVLATSSWLMSLAVNLNPFMRFDGYYVLSDLLDVPNLQSRAFALGRWSMRELLFKLGDNPPEEIPYRLRKLMIVYAWATWIYRLILFVGIALLVYHMFFKALGIILFLVEMGVFVVRPIAAELKSWNERRTDIWASKRARLVMGSGAILFLLACLPLDRHINAPAILAPVVTSPLVAGDAAKIDNILVRNGQMVKAGDPLFELSAPELEADRGQRGLRIKALQERLARSPADGEDLANRMILEGELATEKEAAAGIDRRRSRLIIRAATDGLVSDIGPDIHAGRIIAGNEILGNILAVNRYDVQAYIGEDDLHRIEDSAFATFIPDDPIRGSYLSKLREKGAAAIQRFDQPILASTNGGPIAVNEDAQKTLRPRAALYRLRFETQSVAPPENFIQPQKGIVVIDAEPTSLFGQLFRIFARTLRAESSLR